MEPIDNEFFESYKRLEQLCNDMYSCKTGGISQYIMDMEHCADRGRLCVPTWDTSYQTLKHLRHLRNQLGHSVDIGPLCNEDDLADVVEFRMRLLNNEGPLSLLRKAENTRSVEPKALHRPQTPPAPSNTRNEVQPDRDEVFSPPDTRNEAQDNRSIAQLILFAVLVLLVLFLICR